MGNMKNLEQQVNWATEQKVDNNWLSSEKQQRLRNLSGQPNPT